VSALVIDTSVWISYFAGKITGSAEVEGALQDGRVVLPPVVAAELLSGRLSHRQRRRLLLLLDDLPLAVSDRAHWYRVGQLRSNLQSSGVTISTPDAHVAQCALDLRAQLLTEDGIFRMVSKLAGLELARASRA
jgi:predicted nucleic acid-binding protein